MNCFKCGDAITEEESTPIADLPEAWNDFSSDDDEERLCVECAADYDG